LLQDADVGVGVFPEREEILIGGLGFGGVALQGVSSAELEMGERSDGFVYCNSGMVEDFLELGGCLAALTCRQIDLLFLAFRMIKHAFELGLVIQAS
jgi:hypothetical protein